MAESGVENPIIVPVAEVIKPKKIPLKEINGVPLPDGLEIPVHW